MRDIQNTITQQGQRNGHSLHHRTDRYLLRGSTRIKRRLVDQPTPHTENTHNANHYHHHHGGHDRRSDHRAGRNGRHATPLAPAQVRDASPCVLTTYAFRRQPPDDVTPLGVRGYAYAGGYGAAAFLAARSAFITSSISDSVGFRVSIHSRLSASMIVASIAVVLSRVSS